MLLKGIGPTRARFARFFTSLAGRGQNRESRDCATTQREFVPQIGALILVPIRVGSAFLPRRHISRLRLRKCGRIGVKFPNCDPKQ